ncbi:BON domain-containing protein [Undibacterium jejuense]|uniref:BON domain-containing protein n=1 Tax=Undibacterium jejuense TaxID=1344949 RepID=A0A923HI11_9BURK|nr:BON domain-containing protein [Undibacterium jejuense]
MKTSTELKRDVIAELNWDPSLPANNIGVEVKDGVVTLSGHVGSFVEKWNAERAVQRVVGVGALAVEIEVNLAGSSKRDDADIARTASNVLAWASYVPQDSIKVMVEGGWITLTGNVEWEYQRNSAADAVRRLMGVTGVSNDINLEPSIAAQVVQSDIEAALKRLAKSESANITVHVDGSTVTLAGTTHSWVERDLASQAAWNAPGVKHVKDKIRISM